MFEFTLRRLTVVPSSRGCLPIRLIVFFTIRKWPIASTLRFRLTPHAAAFLAKKTCLRRSIWHSLCSMASICPFARPPLTLGVARHQCLHPRGMTAYPRAFNSAVNLAEHVLFVLFYEQQTPMFVLHCIWPNMSSSSCCLSGTNSLKSFVPYFLFDVAFHTSSIIHVARPQSRALVGCDRHLACCEKKGLCSTAMSVPSWRDRHLACCEIKKDY